MGGNVSPIRQRRDHVIDARFITNVVLSVYIYIWTIYIEHNIYWTYLHARWIVSLLIPKRIIDNSDKAASSICYQLSTVFHCHIGERKSQRMLITNTKNVVCDISIHPFMCRWPNWHQALMYLNQHWLVVSWTLRNKLTWNSNQGAMEKKCCKKSSAKIRLYCLGLDQ